MTDIFAEFAGFEPPEGRPYTLVPNVVFDQLMGHLNGGEFRVLMYLIRRIYGFDKDADAISLSQFKDGIVRSDGSRQDYGCGLSDKSSIVRNLNSLEEKGLIVSVKRFKPDGSADTTLYSLRFKPSDQVVGKSDHPLVGKPDDGSRKTRPTICCC